MTLPVIEEITIKKTGEVRQVVGRLPCDCGESLYVIQGKKNLYTYCTACGVQLSNGRARQDRLRAQIIGAGGAPAAQPAEPEHLAEPEPAPENPAGSATPTPEPAAVTAPPVATMPMSKEIPEHWRGKSLLEIFLEWRPFA